MAKFRSPAQMLPRASQGPTGLQMERPVVLISTMREGDFPGCYVYAAVLVSNTGVFLGKPDLLLFLLSGRENVPMQNK